MAGCIKITATRGNGDCISIKSFRGDGGGSGGGGSETPTIVVTSDKESNSNNNVPPPPSPKLTFKVYDLIGHGINEIIVLGQWMKELDGRVTPGKKGIGKADVVVGFDPYPIEVTQINEFVEISDITENCYLNAFNVKYGTDNIAVLYEGGTKVRYFDSMLMREISFIEDRHGYTYDAFYETDEEMMTGIMVDISVTKTTPDIHYGSVIDYWAYPTRDCSEAWQALYQFGREHFPRGWFTSDCSQKPPQSYSTIFDCGTGGLVTLYAGYDFSPSLYNRPYTDNSRMVDIYSIGNNTKIREEKTMTGLTINSYYDDETITHTEGNPCPISGYITRCHKEYNPISTQNIVFEKIAGRENLYYFDNKITEKEFYPKKVIMQNVYLSDSTGCPGKQNEGAGILVNYSEISFLGIKYSPTKYIQLNGGDPHKIQTSDRWIAVGSACINLDKTFVCENLPTTPCGKTGAVISDRVVIPMDNASGSNALFTLNQEFVITEHQVPAQKLQ